MIATNWIWTPDQRAEDREQVALLLFRREVMIETETYEAHLRISADSRYKLYVNGVMAEMGPSRGDRQVWFYDEVDLTPYLHQGRNAIAVSVLHYPTIHHLGNHGIFRTEYPGLYVRGDVQDGQNRTSLDASAGWKVRRDTGYRIVSEAEGFAPLQFYEDRTGQDWQRGWMYPGYRDEEWRDAWICPNIDAAISPGNLLPRTIPYLYRRERRFEEIVRAHADQAAATGDWQGWMQGDRKITIPPFSKATVELSAGEEMTGYLYFAMEKGAGAELSILQSEAYVLQDPVSGASVKGDRTDHIHGHLEGYTDRYTCSGYGDEEYPEIYEPFWFRTFRYIRVEVQTGQEALVLADCHYTETGYPLQVQTSVTTSDPTLDAVWEISERTLRRCMHETYEDCPFYEQLQYAMDSRSEILYTYAVSADDRLARKCMDDFRRSQRYDGLLNCSYPCYGANVIPGFSIYYILMLHDHMMYFDDRALLEEHMPTVERILQFYHRHLAPEGYVERLGGPYDRDRLWSFIDWTAEWRETAGVPGATLQGPVTMESLLYIVGLQTAAEIAEHLEYRDMAARYRQWCDAVCQAVRQYCVGENGMIQDGPGLERYSQHAQVFGVLSGVLDREQGRENLLRTIRHKEDYAQCSVAMAFYLFRALQDTGLYQETAAMWDVWRDMVAQHLTTCVEDPVTKRSDCHAWGSLALYEMPSVILGVRPTRPGYEEMEICPETGGLTHAEGTVITPRGKVSVQWDQQDDGIHLTWQAPEGIRVRTPHGPAAD